MRDDDRHEDAVLGQRLRAAYPTGLVDELDKAVLESPRRDARIREALKTASSQYRIAYDIQAFDVPAYQTAITQQEHPSFGAWIWQMSNDDKIAWIREHGEPYPVMWLCISRVADYYYYHFNHWVPRGDTGYLDADFSREPNSTWAWYSNVITSCLNERGFVLLTDTLARSRSRAVRERDYDSIPDDDPRWDDDAFEPPLVAATIHRCLFGE